jgi:hypothetical protein
MAARLGLEPRQAESESAVLPLHHQAVENFANKAFTKNGADDWTRTCNRLFTKQVLYQLSYIGLKKKELSGSARKKPNNVEEG